MFRLFFIFSFLIFISLHVGAQDTTQSDISQHPSIELPFELDRVLRDYEEGWRNRDEILLASLFTADGFILRPRHKAVRGRAEIKEAYKNAGGPLFLRALYYEKEDSIAYIIGAYRSKESGPDHGKFIITLKMLPDRKWYLTSDMDNSNK